MLGEKVVMLVPLVMFSSTAQRMAFRSWVDREDRSEKALMEVMGSGEPASFHRWYTISARVQGV